jgi:hypothetical protein
MTSVCKELPWIKSPHLVGCCLYKQIIKVINNYRLITLALRNYLMKDSILLRQIRLFIFALVDLIEAVSQPLPACTPCDVRIRPSACLHVCRHLAAPGADRFAPGPSARAASLSPALSSILTPLRCQVDLDPLVTSYSPFPSQTSQSRHLIHLIK